MAQMLAPYNNSMRLGQGFNSYTHQICLHDAVLVPEHDKPKHSEQSGLHSEDGSSSNAQFTPVSSRLLEYRATDEIEKVEPPDTAQIVSYTARFVDKISEVVDSMNISAALSIQTNTIGGSANGQYIDSDKFKQSDLNYFVQVRVTNQRLDKKAFSHLNLVNPVLNTLDEGEQKSLDPNRQNGQVSVQPSTSLPPVTIDPQKFLEIYGDAFISGWEEGGELNALISVKCKKKSKVTQLKAALEGKVGTPAISGKVSGSLDLNKAELSEETETTITVNWSGGGQIKDRDVLWDVNSLTLAAANFPEQVKKTPQRTYAILSKYTQLPEFQNRISNFTPLDYDIAGVYTSALLDMYTDYKSVWKSLQITSSDVEARQIRLEKAKPSDETTGYLQVYQTKYVEGVKKREDEEKSAEVDREDWPAVLRRMKEFEDRLQRNREGPPLRPAPSQPIDATSVEAEATQPASTQQVVPTSEKKTHATWTPGMFLPYEPTLIGLLHAKTDCRLQMIRIVHEVNAIRKYPKIAAKPDASDILAPSVFKQILPVALANKIVDDEWTGWTDALGTSNADLYKLTSADLSKYPAAAKSAARYADKANHFRLSRYTGVPPALDAPDDTYQFQNDLEKLHNGLIVSNMRVYHNDSSVVGIVLKYTDGTRIKHGNITGSSTEFHWKDNHVLGMQLAQTDNGASLTWRSAGRICTSMP